ncbi:MAG: toll/interleukin-1 receptor domain-containing protein [bacterium]|nr:toll/interleukin-1 receptor domain-containing protein [bacterium]
MYDVFLSYRRKDTGGHAAMLHRALQDRFGDKRVFMDTSQIEAGKKWPDKIDEALEKCTVFLAVIGPDWSTSRLENPEDWVRREIRRALERAINVTPVLLADAQLPTAESLPDELKSLVERQVFEVRDASREADIRRLVGQIPVRPSIRYSLRQRALRLGLLVLAAVLAVVLLAINWCGAEPEISRRPDGAVIAITRFALPTVSGAEAHGMNR